MKDDIKKNFSKGSKTYDDNANVQKYMIDMLLDSLPKKEYMNILEVGCGTGLLTSKLRTLFPSAKLTCVDISEGMIDVCKDKLQDENIEFICCDIERHCPIDEFDLIISSAVLQWITDLPSVLETLKSRLSYGGVLAFSTFATKTFKELDTSLNHIFEKNALTVRQNRNYYSKIELSELILDIFKDELYITTNDYKMYVEYFKNALKFLKSVKAIGANSSEVSKYITPIMTKEIIEYYNQNYSLKDSSNEEFKDFVYATYYLLFYVIEKIN